MRFGKPYRIESENGFNILYIRILSNSMILSKADPVNSQVTRRINVVWKAVVSPGETVNIPSK
jgi:hypothetical protein